jgi:uncharacterized membrane protein YkvA (DUF1232 family)
VAVAVAVAVAGLPARPDRPGPDFIPIIGYADDAIIVAIALRSVIRHAGPHAIERHWPGTGDGLNAIQRLAGTTSSKTP